jgi:hypothetical protein
MTGPFSVDFAAPAELRKWSSLNNQRRPDRETVTAPDLSISASGSSWLSQRQHGICMKFIRLANHHLFWAFCPPSTYWSFRGCGTFCDDPFKTQ